FKVSRDPADVLVTYSLGSCVGVTLFDPVAKVGGMIHSMLPLSKQSPESAARRPLMYVDTGLSELLKTLFDLGATRGNIVAKVAGCSGMIDDKNMFKIGERNLAVTRKVLWKNDIIIAGQDTGDCKPRTMRLFVGNGRTTVHSRNEEIDI
ncbi:MAG: chemotaxis protein CheD, partial [Planctomycetes bacterium]|nr:chemotaxis protein CheD [Planctomycetota bacterium]